ncbi:MAG: glycosyltransferase family 2 protein [Ruegeria sp.]
MTGNQPTWGVVATIRATPPEILRFAAHHLDLGAHRLFLYFDEVTPAAETLARHPRIRVTTCDSEYWKRRKRPRPQKHQVRQTLNASHAYRRGQVDWLTHIDVDEFLWPDSTIAGALSNLPDTANLARVRSVEALSGTDNAYKAFIPAGPHREKLVQEIYPRFGAFVKGGFLSHVAGKVFLRTGLPDIEFRLHNAFQSGQMIRDGIELTQVDLCHHHGHDWADWIAKYRYRLTNGSYRADLAPNTARERGGLTMHELLTTIEADGGESGLRQFFDELSAADPQVRKHLAARDMIRYRDLQLAEKVRKHFPGTA